MPGIILLFYSHTRKTLCNQSSDKIIKGYQNCYVGMYDKPNLLVIHSQNCKICLHYLEGRLSNFHPKTKPSSPDTSCEYMTHTTHIIKGRILKAARKKHLYKGAAIRVRADF